MLDEDTVEVLREVAHVGAGNASKSLSQMTDRKIEVEFPSVKFVDITDLPEKFGGSSSLVTTIFLDVEMERPDKEEKSELGKLVFILEDESAKNLASYMTDSEPDMELTSMEESALKETGNIITGSCISAITEYIDVKLYEEVPRLKRDFLGAIMEHFILPIAKDKEEVLVFKTKFNFDEDVEAYFLFLFHPDAEEFLNQKLNSLA